MFDLLFYDYAKSAVCFKTNENCLYQSARSLDAVLNRICLEHGSSLQGRKDSFLFYVPMKKNIPVLICQMPRQILFPTSSLKDPNLFWVCYEAIEKIETDKNFAHLYFHDGLVLKGLSKALVKRMVKAIESFYSLIDSKSI